MLVRPECLPLACRATITSHPAIRGDEEEQHATKQRSRRECPAAGAMLPAPRHAAQSSLKAPSICYPSAAATVPAGRQHLPMRSPPAAPAAQHIHSALAAPRCVAARRVGAAQPGAGAVPLCCRLAGAQRRAAGIRQRAQRSQNASQVPARRVLPERGLDQHSVLREQQARGYGGRVGTAGAAWRLGQVWRRERSAPHW